MDKKALDRAKKILDAQLNKKPDPKLARGIRAWFIAKGHEEEKFLAMEEQWDKEITPNYKPNASLDREYAEVAQRLDFPEIEYKKSQIKFPARKLVALRHRMMIRVAAVLLPFLVIAGVAYLWVDGARNTTGQHTIAEVRATAGCNSKTVLLADGSIITLYPGAELTYPETFTAQRQVKLTGKAFFQIAKDERNKFVVATDGLNITVHGTQFMVVAFEGAETSRVTLHQGSIEAQAGEHIEMLKPGRQLEYYNSTGEISVQEVELEDWTKPNLEFYMRPLNEILSSLEIYYGIKFENGSNSESLNTKYTIDLTGFTSADNALRLLQGTARSFSYEVRPDAIKVIIK